MQKEQLLRLLSQSDQMTQELISLRNAIVNNTAINNYSKSSQTLKDAIKHRSLLRTLAETLEANRNLVQNDKQKIEKSRIVLQGLDYFKKTLKDKIQAYDTSVESIDQYFDEPLGEIDWEGNYEAGQKRLKQSLQKLKMKDQSYRNQITRKNQLLNNIKQKNKLYTNIMPRHIKKLNDQVLETAKIFGIETNQVLEKIENPRLAYLYDTFKTLKVAEKIDITYSKEQHEFVDLIIKPIGLQLYERALQYGIKIQQKQLKVRIGFLKPQFCKLAIGVDRRSDFSTKQIFHRLINNQPIKIIVEQPTTQSQRNLNNKFVYLQCLEDILCVSAVKSMQFLSLVRSKAFTVSFIKYIFDNIKTSSWLSQIVPAVHSELASKKLLIQNVNKISFQQYSQYVYIPKTLKKSLNTYEEMQKKLTIQNDSQKQHQVKKNRDKLLQLLSKIGLQERLIPETNSYYKLNINYRSLKVSSVIIIPFEYPTIPPKIKIINFQRTQQQNIEAIPAGVQCRANIESKEHLSKQLQALEKQSNHPFSGVNQGQNQPFRLIYYLSKLLDTVYNIQNAYNQRKKGSK